MLPSEQGLDCLRPRAARAWLSFEARGGPGGSAPSRIR
jgi:hypothetical protein